MADRADVVPLRRHRDPESSGPAEHFPDAVDPARALSVSWSIDQATIRIGIEAPDGTHDHVVLQADEVLHLARALVERLPGSDGGGPRSPAAVISLPTRKSQRLSEEP